VELLERASFLDTLAEYAAEAQRGDGRLVLISGESGMGKTALLEAFHRRGKRPRWLWGACDGLLTPRPLGPLFDIAGQVGGELGRLCAAGASRDRLFTAFQAELGPARGFTVVVVEDLHWADEATIDLLSFLGRRLSRMTALVLGTYRDDELSEDHPLRVMLGDLATQRATRRMRLPPLSAAAVRTLAGPRDVDAAELHRVTGGNPFYVTEILEAGWPSVPPTVRDAVAARLARATPATRRAVEAAAVIGTRVDRSLLSAMLAGEDAAAGEMLSTGIFIDEGTTLRFRHELVRMAVEAAMTPGRKAELHASLVAIFEDRGDADPAVLAHHAEGAQDEKAVRRHARAAAARAAALSAHREAAAQYERALRFAASQDKPTLAALHEGLAAEYALLDRWEETERALRAALACRRELGDAVRAGADLRLLATTLWRLCRGADSAQAAVEAVEILQGQRPCPELAWAYASLGVNHLLFGRVDEGLSLIERSRHLGERLHQPDVVSYALNAIGLTHAELGKDGTGPLKDGLRIALDADLQEAAGRIYTSLQEVTTQLHRFEDAGRYYAEGIAFCEDRELGVFSLCLQGGRAAALLLTGQWDEAAEIAGQMLGHSGISPINQLNPLRALGLIRGRRGEPAAWDLLDEGLALAEGTGEPAWIVPAREARAEMHWLAGQPGPAAAEATAAYACASGFHSPWTLGSAAIWLARLGLPGGLPADLPEPFALEIAGDRRQAALAWERLGRPYDAALTRLGSADEAELRQALGTFDELGARVASAAARRRMKQLGVRAIPRGPRAATRAAPAGLTAREQEVLALLCEGLPDRAISQRLCISERTVHHHVSAVLSKIGVSSRTAAAREAARMGIGALA
jgi:DNA-binding CsgD family transcriptional regulator